MICEATYASLDAIPEALREEFEQVGGKWQLKPTAIPGVGPLFNSALAANEQKAVGQVKTRNVRIKELETQVNDLENKLAVVDIPGHKVLSKEDSDLFDKYAKLGTPAELETQLAAAKDALDKAQRFEITEALNKVAGTLTGINSEVLSDWALGNPNLKFFTKSVEQTDAKGLKTTVEVPFVRIEEEKNGKVEVSEKELLPFAKESLPDWKYAALTTAADGKKVTAPTAQAPVKGVRLPDLGSTQTAPAGGSTKERPIDTFNKQRDARPSPFAKPLAATGMAKVG